MAFQNILFDLDGTLTESGPGITRSVQYALHQMGIEEPDLQKLEPFVGPPLNLSFRERYGMNEEETGRAIHYFRESYDTKGIYENNVYPGVRELLQQLHEQGSRLAIASSKPEPMVHRVLEHFGIAGYFDVIVGSHVEEELDNKMGADNKLLMVKKALQGLGLSVEPGGGAAEEPEPAMTEEPEPAMTEEPGPVMTEEPGPVMVGEPEPVMTEALRQARRKSYAMVGDRSFDMNGAKANHVTAVGVSYGYGSRRELEEAGADFIADTVEELGRILMADGE